MGMRLVVDSMGPSVVPCLWAVNGVASVLGSAGAMAMAKVAGFEWTGILGLGIYLLAARVVLMQNGT
jgi:hypothetical protein